MSRFYIKKEDIFFIFSFFSKPGLFVWVLGVFVSVFTSV